MSNIFSESPILLQFIGSNSIFCRYFSKWVGNQFMRVTIPRSNFCKSWELEKFAFSHFSFQVCRSDSRMEAILSNRYVYLPHPKIFRNNEQVVKMKKMEKIPLLYPQIFFRTYAPEKAYFYKERRRIVVNHLSTVELAIDCLRILLSSRATSVFFGGASVVTTTVGRRPPSQQLKQKQKKVQMRPLKRQPPFHDDDGLFRWGKCKGWRMSGFFAQLDQQHDLGPLALGYHPTKKALDTG